MESDRRLIVLDTSVLLDDPNVIDKIKSSIIVVPMTVVEELDEARSRKGDVGASSRTAINNIERLCQTGDIEKGVKTENGSLVFIDIHGYIPSDINDNSIIKNAKHIKKEINIPTVISNDLGMRIKSRALGMYADSWEQEESEYLGYSVLDVQTELIDKFYKEEGIVLDDINLHANEYVNLNGYSGGSALGKFDGGKIKPIKKRSPWDIRPQGREQIFAVDALFDEDIPLVTLTGVAGVGKTYLTLASALELVIAQQKYDRIIITRPLEQVGRNELGFFPGEKDEKLFHWMSGFMDNFEQLFGNRDSFDMYKRNGYIEFESIALIRGRSLNNAILVVDEAQNLTKKEAKVVITRMGSNSKIVLLGDISQIDNPFISRRTNGLTQVIDAFKDSHLAAHVALVEHSQSRSELATLATKVL
jgi:PhoH-like ATPase